MNNKGSNSRIKTNTFNQEETSNPDSNNNNTNTNTNANIFQENANNFWIDPNLLQLTQNHYLNNIQQLGLNNTQGKKEQEMYYYLQQFPQFQQNNIFQYINNLPNFYQQIFGQNPFQNQYNFGSQPFRDNKFIYPQQQFSENFTQMGNLQGYKTLSKIEINDFYNMIYNEIAPLQSQKNNLTKSNTIDKVKCDANNADGEVLNEINEKIECMKQFNLVHEIALKFIENQRKEIELLFSRFPFAYYRMNNPNFLGYKNP